MQRLLRNRRRRQHGHGLHAGGLEGGTRGRQPRVRLRKPTGDRGIEGGRHGARSGQRRALRLPPGSEACWKDRQGHRRGHDTRNDREGEGNARKVEAPNAEVRLGEIKHLPVSDASSRSFKHMPFAEPCMKRLHGPVQETDFRTLSLGPCSISAMVRDRVVTTSPASPIFPRANGHATSRIEQR